METRITADETDIVNIIVVSLVVKGTITTTNRMQRILMS